MIASYSDENIMIGDHMLEVFDLYGAEMSRIERFDVYLIALQRGVSNSKKQKSYSIFCNYKKMSELFYSKSKYLRSDNDIYIVVGS